MAGPWENYKAQAPSQGPWAKYDTGFQRAVERVLKAEGGYVNDPVDRGGETKYGISKRANPEVDIASLTVDQAKDIYRKKYWEAIDAPSLPPLLREVAFDAAVNQGVGWTKRALSRAKGDFEEFMRLRSHRYAAIIRKDPSQAKFQRGWENRLESFRGPWIKYGGSDD